MSAITLAAEIAQWVALVALAVLIVGHSGILADVQRRLGPDAGVLVPNDGLAIGTAAPVATALDARTGASIELAPQGRPASLLVFMSPACGPCIRLTPELNRLAEARPDLPIVVVTAAADGYDYAENLRSGIGLVRDEESLLQQAFAVDRTPFAYVFDEQGTVGVRAVPNTYVDLEDALAGYGRPQGTDPWVPGDDLAGIDSSSGRP